MSTMGMHPCLTPWACGVKNHREGTTCKGKLGKELHSPERRKMERYAVPSISRPNVSAHPYKEHVSPDDESWRESTEYNIRYSNDKFSVSYVTHDDEVSLEFQRREDGIIECDDNGGAEDLIKKLDAIKEDPKEDPNGYADAYKYEVISYVDDNYDDDYYENEN